ncbi:hypothetical protein HK101_000795 [Irineochytrium annulatum]|nr:hypothetical protein HK101_000795 [Irineochytrium annulatum]
MEGGAEAGGEKKDPAKGINLINKNATNAIIVVAFLTGLLFICLLVSMSSRGEGGEPDVDLDDHSALDNEKVMLIAGGQPSYNANGTLKEITAPVWVVSGKAADGTTRQRTNMGAAVASKEETIANKAGMAAIVHHN